MLAIIIPVVAFIGINYSAAIVALVMILIEIMFSILLHFEVKKLSGK